MAKERTKDRRTLAVEGNVERWKNASTSDLVQELGTLEDRGYLLIDDSILLKMLIRALRDELDEREDESEDYFSSDDMFNESSKKSISTAYLY